MSTSRLLAATALVAALAAAGFAFAQGSRAPADGRLPAGMTIPQIHDRLVGQGYWNIDKIERESGSFEVRARDRNGDRVKLHLDERSGEIIDRRSESRSRDRARRGDDDDDRRWGADCNERRCRDDLPPSGAVRNNN